jgi:guanine deaminase
MLIIRGGRLLDARAHIAPLVDVLVDGDAIVAVGRPGLAAPGTASVLDAKGRLMMPGLVNAHTHSHGNLAKGMGDRWTLELLLNAGPWMSGSRNVEEKYLSTLIGAVEMVRKGCTACYDLFYEFPAPSQEGLEAVAQAYRDVGMRAVIAPMMADRTFYQAIPGLLDDLPADVQADVDRLALAPWPVSLEATRQALQSWKFDRGQIALALGPTIPLHCSDDFIAGCRDTAKEFAAGVHMHLAESKVQAVAGVAKYGKTLTAHLDTLGVLGPHFTAAHAIWLDSDDIARLADRGASVAHNPGSNMRLGSGLAAVRAMRDRDVHVGIGTDAASCSDNLNMFEAMRLASFVSRVQGPDSTRWLATEEVLEMATTESARALGFGAKLGRIAPGFKADIVFLDLTHVNYIPLNDPTNQIVHTEDSSGVHSVMIGGRLVVDGGTLTTVATAKLPVLAEVAMTRLRSANEAAKKLAQKLAPVVGRFCGALAGRDYHVQRYGVPQTR